MIESTFVASNKKTHDEQRRADVMHILEKRRTVHYEDGTMILKDAYDGYGDEEAADDIMELFAWVI